MRYLHSKLKARRGETLEVTFDQPAKVMVMPAREFKRYKENKTFTYFGGFKEDSPYAVALPRDGEWHTVVELGSYYNPKNIVASVKLVAGAAAPLPSAASDYEEPEEVVEREAEASYEAEASEEEEVSEDPEASEEEEAFEDPEEKE